MKLPRMPVTWAVLVVVFAVSALLLTQAANPDEIGDDSQSNSRPAATHQDPSSVGLTPVGLEASGAMRSGAGDQSREQRAEDVVSVESSQKLGAAGVAVEQGLVSSIEDLQRDIEKHFSRKSPDDPTAKLHAEARRQYDEARLFTELALQQRFLELFRSGRYRVLRDGDKPALVDGRTARAITIGARMDGVGVAVRIEATLDGPLADAVRLEKERRLQWLEQVAWDFNALPHSGRLEKLRLRKDSAGWAAENLPFEISIDEPALIARAPR